jgi:hypothetical protein
LNVLIFMFLDSRWENKIFWTECSKHYLNSISS